MKVSFGSFGVSILMTLHGAGLARAYVRGQAAEYELVVHVYNLANVSDRTVDRAARCADAILATAGIATVWVKGHSNALEARTLDLSRSALQKSNESRIRKDLVLLISRNVPSNYGKGALGIALPGAQIGVSAMVFYDRLELLARTVEIEAGSMLGFAVAHEIGHVLLQNAEHSPLGVMKSPWSKADLQQASARLSEFTASECKAMSQRIGRAIPVQTPERPVIP